MPNLTLPPRIMDFLMSHSNLWGVKIVLLVTHNPDNAHHVIRLTHIIEPNIFTWMPQRHIDRMLASTSGIPMTDETTLKAVDRDINRQLGIKAELMSMNMDYSRVDAEIAALLQYRKETSGPFHKIQNFRSVERLEYTRHKKAILYLLSLAKDQCPEAWYLIKTHLQTGVYFTWNTYAEARNPRTKTTKTPHAIPSPNPKSSNRRKRC